MRDGLVKRFLGKLKSLLRRPAPPEKPRLRDPRGIDWTARAKPQRRPSTTHELNERRRKANSKSRRRKAGKQARRDRRRNRGRAA